MGGFRGETFCEKIWLIDKEMVLGTHIVVEEKY